MRVYDYATSPVLLWVIMVTSAAHRRWTGDVEVTDLRVAGLPSPSIIRTAKIATVEAKDTPVIGCIAEADRISVSRQLADFLTITVSNQP